MSLCREEFYGNGFWLAVARKRQSENQCKNVKQLIQLSCETEAAEKSKDSRALAKRRRNQWNGGMLLIAFFPLQTSTCNHIADVY